MALVFIHRHMAQGLAEVPLKKQNKKKHSKTSCTAPSLDKIQHHTRAVENELFIKNNFLHIRLSGQWENQGVSHAPFAVCRSLAGIQFQFPQVTEYRRAAHTDRYKLLRRQTLISKCRSNGGARLPLWQRDSDGNWGRVISLSVSLPIRQEISGTCPIAAAQSDVGVRERILSHPIVFKQERLLCIVHTTQPTQLH